MQTVVLTSTDIEACASMDDVIGAVEAAFGAYARGDAQMPAKSYIDLPQYNGDFRSMPTYMDAGEWDAAGIKWVNVHPDNPDANELPTVMGTMVYSDRETAFTLAIMDGTTLTMKRTGVAAAVAMDHLAVADATSLGIVGAGVQSYTQLEAISEVRDIETVVADREEAAVTAVVDEFDDRFDVCAGGLDAAASCDVLSTVTPVETPIITPEMLGDHTQINAIGADAAGKHELADDIFLGATLVIDDHAQTTHSGEINAPYSEGMLTDADIHADLGRIVVGEKTGRTGDDGITAFDSTELAIQDVAAAHVAYETVREQDCGLVIGMVDTSS
ncbi:ornithine cyclodeaminase family protein [Haladaptatus sp. NG-WS-4]